MELFGAISADQWRSNDLNEIYSSDHHHHHNHLISSDSYNVTNYDPSHIGPFTIWPSFDSTIVHDMPSSANHSPLDFFHGNRNTNVFLSVGCDGLDHDWMNVNGEESGVVQSRTALVFPCEPEMIPLSEQPSIGLKSLSGNSKKRARSVAANDDLDSKSKRNVKLKRSQKIVESDDDVNKDVKFPISPNSPLSPGEHSNASQDELGATISGPTSAVLNLNGKARASRGSATDPQSVYARKRREKINERLKTLQSLVPNGTKVDISTMLEEAVQYVKFLQLQIKLLSSDDLWMYAPLAYNGMGIGLDLGLNSPRL